MIRMVKMTMLIIVSAFLVSCVGHGRYTSAFKEESIENMTRMRAATDYDQALQQFNSGDLDRALRTIDGSIMHRSGVPQSHALRGRILFELGRTQAALDSLDRATQLNPDNADLHYLRGIVLERQGRSVESLESYRTALKFDGERPEYLLAVAEALIELGDIAEGRSLLENPPGDLSWHPGVRQMLGHLAMMREDAEEAFRQFAAAVLLSPKDPVLLEDLCRAQTTTRRWAEAEATLRGLAKDPGYDDRPDLRLLHATSLLELDRPVEARRILLDLTRGPEGRNDVGAWIRLVDVAVLLQDPHMLRDAADHLIATAPTRPEGYLALATWQRQAGDLSMALSAVEDAIERAPDDSTAHRLKALIEYDRQQQAAEVADDEIIEVAGEPRVPERAGELGVSVVEPVAEEQGIDTATTVLAATIALEPTVVTATTTIEPAVLAATTAIEPTVRHKLELARIIVWTIMIVLVVGFCAASLFGTPEHSVPRRLGRAGGAAWDTISTGTGRWRRRVVRSLRQHRRTQRRPMIGRFGKVPVARHHLRSWSTAGLRRLASLFTRKTSA